VIAVVQLAPTGRPAVRHDDYSRTTPERKGAVTMRRSVPQYCHHKASGQAYVKIDGRTQYLGVFGSPDSHKAYAAAIAEWQERQDSPPKKLTVGQLAVLYVGHCERYYRKNGKPTSELQAVRDTIKRVNRLHRTTAAKDFTPAMLKAVRQVMIEEGLARSTINGSAGRIRRMFRWAVGDGNQLVPATVAYALEQVSDLKFGRSTARETDAVKPVPDVCVDAIKPFVSRQVWGMIQFQRTTGARPGEALIVRGCDLNMSGKVWEYRPAIHKTEHHGKSRIVFIGPQGKAVLREFLTTDLQKYLFSPREAVTELAARKYREGARIRDVGDRYTLHSYASAIRRGCEKAFKMPEDLTKAERKAWRKENCWSANRLRHSFATTARREAGIEAARIMLGHSSAVTTEIYAEADYEAARGVIAKIG